MLPANPGETPTPYLMSIEETPGTSREHGFHLGTEESTARIIVRETFRARVLHQLPVVSVALKDAKGKIVDVFDGEWASERADRAFEEMATEREGAAA